MVSLILLVCLAASPGVCQEERPPMDAVSSTACMMQGQLIAVEWLEEHPKWMLKGWQCRSGPPERAT
jgi:hypothetical protein